MSYGYIAGLLAAGILGAMGTGAYALTAVAVGSTSGSTTVLEGQGFNGRMSFQNISGTAGPLVSGITSDGNVVSTLTKSFSTGPSTITEKSLSGATTVTINLPLALDDIAYSNGQLYGVVTRNDALQIVQINANGTTTPVATQTLSSYSGAWRLSGMTAGSGLVALRSSNGFSPTATVESIDPAAGTVAAVPISSTIASTVSASGDMVVNLAGNTATFTAGPFQSALNPQQQITLPGGATGGTLSNGARYGSSSFLSQQLLSDEFNYAWDPSKNGVESTSITTSTPSAFNKLYRTPFVWQGSANATLTNGIAPDGTTITNVSAAMPFRTSGPVAMQSNVTASAPGAFSARTIGSGNFSVDLNGSPRGVYTIDTRTTLTGSYTHGGVTEDGRTVDNYSYSSKGFAYDPISSNIIGNGDFELSYYGWDDVTNPNFVTQPFILQDGAPGNHVPWITGSTTLREILEESTAAGPMMLSFDYRLDTFPGGTFGMDVLLAGKNLAHVNLTTGSDTYSHYSVLLTDPSLQNLSGAEFRVQMTANGSAWAYVDNFSLVAVPEPGTLGVGAVAMAMLLRRKKGN